MNWDCMTTSSFVSLVGERRDKLLLAIYSWAAKKHKLASKQQQQIRSTTNLTQVFLCKCFQNSLTVWKGRMMLRGRFLEKRREDFQNWERRPYLQSERCKRKVMDSTEYNVMYLLQLDFLLLAFNQISLYFHAVTKWIDTHFKQ